MKVKETDRGFRILSHLPYPPKGDEEVRLVQESSAIGDYDDAMENPGSSFLYLGSEHHLNREEVGELIYHLQHWLSEGRLPLSLKPSRDLQPGESCHDCGVQVGQFHEPGCDMEECPFCHHQLIGCDCCYEHLNLDADQEPTLSEGLNEEQEKQWGEILRKKGPIPYGSEERF